MSTPSKLSEEELSEIRAQLAKDESAGSWPNVRHRRWLLAALSAKDERIKTLEAALEPLARMAESPLIDTIEPPFDECCRMAAPGHQNGVAITFADVRRAAAALKGEG